ncbi:hypothetical protein [Heyndrickxia ginsengihumi]|uniref:Uncharacterized protein n=2 Tax=Heyndrickxia ginsengihumi TaxID=363870 RepID=A0A0A6V9G9_9BACI|nr:hypothetical protein [Heyndrickxia ginsengihumi]KHD84226.1 hypothetical protein NG54_16900 [Heyndrickxia ginsengihumi]MBE6184888.1 hypothetical protein [Bacillus sp. (in: firmicutes)]
MDWKEKLITELKIETQSNQLNTGEKVINFFIDQFETTLARPISLFDPNLVEIDKDSPNEVFLYVDEKSLHIRYSEVKGIASITGGDFEVEILVNKSGKTYLQTKDDLGQTVKRFVDESLVDEIFKQAFYC